MRFPGTWVHRRLARYIGDAEDGDDRTFYICLTMSAWATLWFAIPLLTYVYLWPHNGEKWGMFAGEVMKWIAWLAAQVG